MKKSLVYEDSTERKNAKNIDEFAHKNIDNDSSGRLYAKKESCKTRNAFSKTGRLAKIGSKTHSERSNGDAISKDESYFAISAHGIGGKIDASDIGNMIIDDERLGMDDGLDGG